MSSSLENALVYCQEKVAPEASSLHYATLFLPPQEKRFWLGLFALNQELRTASMKQLEAGLSQIKLGWWRQALSQAGQEPQPHPVIVAISQQTIARMPSEHWPTLIEAVVSSCEAKRFSTPNDWDHMLGLELEPWISLIGQHVGEDDTHALLAFWVAATQACQILRFAKYLDQQFQPIPISILQEYGVTAEQIRRREHDEKTSALFQAVFMQRAQVAEIAWKKIPLKLRLFSRPLRALFRMRLKEFSLHTPDFLLLREQKMITPWHKFSTAWTTHVLRR